MHRPVSVVNVAHQHNPRGYWSLKILTVLYLFASMNGQSLADVVGPEGFVY